MTHTVINGMLKTMTNELIISVALAAETHSIEHWGGGIFESYFDADLSNIYEGNEDDISDKLTAFLREKQPQEILDCVYNYLTDTV